MNQYEVQKHRGTEGFGVFNAERGHLVRTTKERKILSWLRNHPSSSVLFHHRFPTSTDNVKNACHPFSTRQFFDTNYVLVHNGHITNASELKAEHEKLGIEYYSVQPDGRFNDSEALLWDVALYLEGKQDVLKAAGSIAFICRAIPKDKRKSTKLFFGRNTNPLNMVLKDNKYLFLSSEGEGEPIDTQKLYEYNFKTAKLTSKDLRIPSYHYEPTYGDYPSSYTWDRDFWKRELEEDNEVLDDYSYDMDLLPDSFKPTYETIFGEGKLEPCFYVTEDGDAIDIVDTVRRYCGTYLDETGGNYDQALDMLDEYLDYLTESLNEDQSKGLKPDEDLILEKDVTKACLTVLFTSPYYRDEASIDPFYQQLLIA